MTNMCLFYIYVVSAGLCLCYIQMVSTLCLSGVYLSIWPIWCVSSDLSGIYLTYLASIWCLFNWPIWCLSVYLTYRVLSISNLFGPFVCLSGRQRLERSNRHQRDSIEHIWCLSVYLRYLVSAWLSDVCLTDLSSVYLTYRVLSFYI